MRYKRFIVYEWMSYFSYEDKKYDYGYVGLNCCKVGKRSYGDGCFVIVDCCCYWLVLLFVLNVPCLFRYSCVLKMLLHGCTTQSSSYKNVDFFYFILLTSIISPTFY